MQTRQILTIRQIAEELNISVQRVHQLIKEDRLKAEKIGRDWVVASAALTDNVRNRSIGRPAKTK
jgi:excisionase family DNA binding protein